MFYHFFKISILSLCIIILIHYIINYLKITLTKPKIMDYTFKQKKQEDYKQENYKQDKQEDYKQQKQENYKQQKQEDYKQEDLNFMKDELTEFLNGQI